MNQEDSEQNEVDGTKKGANSMSAKWSPLVNHIETDYSESHAVGLTIPHYFLSYSKSQNTASPIISVTVFPNFPHFGGTRPKFLGSVYSSVLLNFISICLAFLQRYAHVTDVQRQTTG